MALQIGSLYVSLSAQTSAFAKGMAGAMKDLERFAKETKKVANEVAQMSAVMAGVGMVALKLASSVDGPTKAAMDGMEKSTKLLAVQVADMLLPAVKEMTAIFQRAAGVVAGLDPEVKKHISSFAVLAVQLAVAAKALAMFSGMAANVFGVLKGAFAMVASVGLGPLLSIAIAVGAVIAVVVLLHRAWRKNWGGIQETTAEVLNWLRDGFGQFAGFMGKVWDVLVDGGARFVESLLTVIDAIQEVTGKKLIDTAGLREGFGGLWKDLKSGSFFSEAFKFGKTVGQQVADGLAEEFAAIKKELGLDQLFKQGKPIALGRGMGAARPDAAPSMDTSSTGVMAWFGGMQAAAADGEGAMTRIAVSFSASEIAANEAAMSAQAQADAAARAEAEAKETARKWAGVGRIVLGGVTKALGEVGSLINSAIEGAKDGGVWGAIIAVIMEVVQKTKSAMEFLGTAMNFVSKLAEMFEPLVKPIFDVFTDILGMLSNVLAPIIKAVKPFADSFVHSIENLMPVFAALGPLLEALAPIVNAIGGVVDTLTKAAGPIFELIAGALKVVATVILGIIIGLNEIAAAFGDEAAAAESARLKGIVDKMWAPGADALAIAEGKAAGAAMRNATAQDEAAQAAQRVAESLTNVPTGYRLANARYQADLGITSGNAFGAGSAASAGGVVINGNVNVTSSSDTIGGVAADAKKEAVRERGQRTGSPRPRKGWEGD